MTTDWLESHLGDPDLRVVDMRGYVSTRPIEPGVDEATYRGAIEEYLAGHIPGAVCIDWTADIVDPDDPVPAQLAGPERFAEIMCVRGIGDATHVVAVDHMGGQFATRLWWALRYYGHDAVSVLDGGLNRWVEEGRPVEEGPVSAPSCRCFTPSPGPPSGRRRQKSSQSWGRRRSRSSTHATPASTPARSRRRPARRAHPGGAQRPSRAVLRRGRRFLPMDESAAGGARRPSDKPVIAYCNGGVAATVALFNLFRLGRGDLTNYDGSWNEWGPSTDLPAETGER